LPTNKVKPYLDGNKNNAHDAAAICEASSRPSMRWLEPKTIAVTSASGQLGGLALKLRVWRLGARGSSGQAPDR
jgi:transposase